MGIVLVGKRWEYRVNCEEIRKVCKSVFPASTQNIPQRLTLASGKQSPNIHILGANVILLVCSYVLG